MTNFVTTNPYPYQSFVDSSRRFRNDESNGHIDENLLIMIEEVRSEEMFFALRTPDGQKYTPEIFLFDLIIY